MAQTYVNGHEQLKASSVTSAEVDSSIIVAGGGNAFTGDQSMGSHKLTNLAAPTNPNDAARLTDVQAGQAGLDPKASVRAATASALASYTYATLVMTASANGAIGNIDGVAVVLNDRILVKNETGGNQKYNGIYTLTQVGDGGTPWKLTRASDADSSAEMTAGVFCFVEEGATFADTGWVLTTDNPITLDTTALSFSQFTGIGSLVAGAGLTKTGNTIDVVAADNSITVNADSIQIAYSGTPSTQAIGDSASAGTSVYPAHTDHKHAMPSFGTPGTSRSGDSAAQGSSVNVAASDHTHGRETWSFNEGVSGTVNGINTTFTVAHTPNPSSIMLFLNGICLQPGAGNDYTISTSTITMLFAPLTGDKLIASYMYQEL